MENSSARQPNFLQFFPLTFFAVVSSLSSLAYAWSYFGNGIKEAISLSAIALFILFFIIFMVKWIKYPGLVKQDFNDPVGVNLFAVFFTALLLVTALVHAYSPQLAFVLWIIASTTTFIFTYSLFTRWISQQQSVLHALPGWTIPIFGLLDIPLTGWSYPGAAVHEICIFFFITGLLFTGIVFILVFQRLMFQEGLATALQPTLLLLSGPFALLYANYQQITGKQDLTADFFFYSSIFLLLLLGRKLVFSLLKVQFTITWWATSFPLAAITAASFRFASNSPLPGARIVLFLLIAVSTLVFVMLSIQTLYYIVAHFVIKGCPKPKKRVSLGDYRASVLPVKKGV
jgi:tellurite resistance protein